MRNSLKRILSALLIIMLVFAATPIYAAEDTADTSQLIGTITGGELKMRAEPSTSSKVLGYYKSGTEVQVLSIQGNWCQVSVKDKVGYMMTKFLDIAYPTSSFGCGITANDGSILNLHQEASGDSPVVYKCFSGAKFELVEKLDGWYKVRSGGILGYLESSLIEETEEVFSILSYPASANPYVLNPSQFSYDHEAGTQRSMSGSRNGFLYDISYPVLALGSADALISNYVHTLIDTVEKDCQTYHTAATAHLSLDYSAVLLDNNYISVQFLGAYTVDDTLSLPIFHALTIDAHTGEPLVPSTLFSSADRIVFQLQTLMDQVFGGYIAEYCAQIDESLLRRAFLTKDGVAFFLNAGELFSLSMGAQYLMLPYARSADYIALDTPFIANNKRVIDPSKPMIALTFDDGPSEETLRIVEALEQYGSRATFCVVGNRLEMFDNVLRSTAASGQEIACHTWSHRDLEKISESQVRYQISSVNEMVKEMTGYDITALRPPYGSYNKRVRNICAEYGMIIAMWTVDTKDWVSRNENSIYNKIMKGAENGAIILCHDIYKSTADAVVRAIPELIQEGYQLVTLSELFSFHKDGVTPGTVYIRLSPENIDTTK